jgi:phasin family protein
MSAFTPEHLIERNRANVANLFALTDQVFDGFRQLVELNLATARAAGAERASLSLEMLSSTTPEEWIRRQTSRFQPMSEQILSYASNVCDIVRDTHSKCAEAAQEHYQAKDLDTSKS